MYVAEEGRLLLLITIGEREDKLARERLLPRAPVPELERAAARGGEPLLRDADRTQGAQAARDKQRRFRNVFR